MYVCLSLNYYSKKSMEIMELPQERTHARSEEEDDQLEISNKKVRAGGPSRNLLFTTSRCLLQNKGGFPSVTSY